MICKNCKREIPDGCKYCYLCGTIFEDQDTNDSSQKQANNLNTMGTYNRPQQQAENMNPNHGYSAPNQQAMNMNPNNGYRPQQPPPIIKPKKNKKGVKTLFIVLGSIVGVILLLLFVLIMVAAFSDDSSSDNSSSNSIGTTSNVNFGPQIDNIVMATSIDETTSQATEIAEYFTPSSPIIYAVCEVSGFKDASTITAEWYYLETNELYGTQDLSVDINEGFVNFYAELTDGNWLPGQYKIVFYIDGVKENEHYFDVKEGGTSINTSSGAGIIRTVMSKGEDSSEPVDITDYFSQDSPVVYVFCEVSELDPNCTITYDWYYIDQYTLITSLDQTPGFSQGVLYCSLTQPDNGWPAGEYSVVISIDGSEQAEHSFYVE